MPSMDEIKEAVYRGRFDDQMSKGAEAAAKRLKELGDTVVVTDEKVKKADKTFESLNRRYDENAKLTAALARATREYERVVRTANAAVEAGARTQAEADELIRRAMLMRDAATQKASTEAAKQKASYDQLEQAAIKAARGMGILNDATEKATRFQAELNKLLGVSGSGGDYDKRAADINAYGRALDDLRAKINPLFAAEQKFTDSMAELNMALKVGAINTIEASLAADRYRVSLESMARAATAASQARFNNLAGITLPDNAMSASRGEDIAAYGRSLDELRAKLNPVFAAELQFKTAIEEVNRALKTGAINQQEATNAVHAYTRAMQGAKAEAVALGQTKLNNMLGIVMPDVEKSASRAADIQAMGTAIDGLRAKYVPLEGAAIRYRKALDEIRDAERKGVLTAKEAAAAKAVELKNHSESIRMANAVAAAHSNSANRIALTSQQLVQLSYQMNDVIAQSAVGTSPFIIFAQQGPQVAQALGGWTASFRMLLSAINPVTVAMAAFAVAVGAPLLAVNAVEARLSNFRNSLRMFREDYAQTAQFLETETRRINLESPGFSLGEVTDASKLIEQARAISQVNTPLSDLVALTRDLSKAMGVDLVKAAEEVAKAMRDPATMARELAERGFPGVNEQLRRQIELLQRSGERQQAFTLLQSAMSEQIRKAAEDMTPFERALSRMTTLFKEFWEAIRPGLETVGRWMIDWISSVAGRFVALAEAIGAIRAATSGTGSPQAAPGGAFRAPVGGGAAPSNIRDAIGQMESGNNYGNRRNEYGFMGRYQFGMAALTDVGMYQPGPGDLDARGRVRQDRNNWTGTFNYPGVRTLDEFLASPAAQDAAYEAYAAIIGGIIDRNQLVQPGAMIQGTPVTRDALIGAGWAGPGHLQQFVQSGGAFNPADGNGMRMLERFLMFSRNTAQGGTAPTAMSYSLGAPAPSQPVPVRDQTQASIDAAIRAAQGYSGQNTGTRQNAMADIANFTQARTTIEQQNEALRRQRDELTAGTTEWQRLDDQVTRNNDSIRTLNTGIDGARGTMATTRTQVEELMHGWERAGEAVRDSGSGFAFVRDRLAELDQASMRQRGTAATQEERARATTLALGELNSQYRNTTAQIDRQIAGTRRQNEAYAQGAQAMQTMEMIERAREEVRKTTIAGTDAEAVAIANLADKYQQLANAEAERAVARRNNDLQQDLAMLQAEADTIGMSAVNRERELAAARATRAILQENPNADLGSDINRRNINLSANLAQGRVELERMQSSFNEIARIGQQAFDRIGSAITTAFVEGNIQSINWKNITKAAISEVVQAMLRLAILNPLLNAAFGQNNPTLGSVIGVSSRVGGGNSGGGLMGSLTGGGGSNGMLSQANSLYSVGKQLFGGSSGSSTGIMGYVNNPIWQSGAGFFAPAGLGATNSAIAAMGSAPGVGGAMMPLFGPAVPGAAGVGSTGMLGTLGSVSLGTYAAGIGGGYMLGTTFGNMIAETEAQRTNVQVGSGVGAVGGAVAGAMIGSVVPVIGTAIGAIIGGLVGGAGGGSLGGVIGPSNEFKGGDVGIGIGPDGMLMVTGAAGKRWDAKGAMEATQGGLNTVNQLLSAGGIRINADAVGGNNWARGSGGKTIGFQGSGGSFNEMGPTELFHKIRAGMVSESAQVTELLTKAFIQSFEDLNKTLPFVLQNNPNMMTALRGGGIKSVDDVGEAYNFIVGIYEPLQKVAEQTSSWADRIKAINDTFGSAISTANRFGLATTELAARQSEAVAQFHKDYALVLRGFNTDLKSRRLIAEAAVSDDPVEAARKNRQAALLQFDLAADKEKKELETQLKDLYLNVWNPGQYSKLILEQDQTLAAERLALWKQYESQITRAQDSARQSVVSVLEGLVEYAAGLRTGAASPLSPLEKLNAARSRFDKLSAAGIGGDFDSLQQLRGASDTYLSLARDVYGGGIGYATAFEDVLEVLGQVGDLKEDVLTASAFEAMSRENTELVVDRLNALLVEFKALTVEVRQSNNIPASVR